MRSRGHVAAVELPAGEKRAGVLRSCTEMTFQLLPADARPAHEADGKI